jgi:hypothetical protein
MLNKAYELIVWIYEKHISVCHGRRTLETYFIALLSSQTLNYHISNIGNTGHLSEVNIVFFVTSIA